MKNTKKSGITVITKKKDVKEYVQYLPHQDPLLKQFYLARVAAHLPGSVLTFKEELCLAYQALAVWRQDERENLGIE